MLAVGGFAEHVRLVAPKARYLLLQPNMDLRHHILIAMTPQLVSMRERTGHAPTRRLDNMLPDRFRIEWRWFPVPVDDSAAGGLLLGVPAQS